VCEKITILHNEILYAHCPVRVIQTVKNTLTVPTAQGDRIYAQLCKDHKHNRLFDQISLFFIRFVYSLKSFQNIFCNVYFKTLK
jgi:hypothetical protein